MIMFIISFEKNDISHIDLIISICILYFARQMRLIYISIKIYLSEIKLNIYIYIINYSNYYRNIIIIHDPTNTIYTIKRPHNMHKIKGKEKSISYYCNFPLSRLTNYPKHLKVPSNNDHDITRAVIHDGSWFSFSDWTSHGESTCTEEISRMRHLLSALYGTLCGSTMPLNATTGENIEGWKHLLRTINGAISNSPRFRIYIFANIKNIERGAEEYSV